MEETQWAGQSPPRPHLDYGRPLGLSKRGEHSTGPAAALVRRWRRDRLGIASLLWGLPERQGGKAAQTHDICGIGHDAQSRTCALWQVAGPRLPVVGQRRLICAAPRVGVKGRGVLITATEAGHAEDHSARAVVLRGRLFGLRKAHPASGSAFTR